MPREIDHWLQQVPYGAPVRIVTVYGYPITVDERRHHNGNIYRIAAWVEGEQGRTRPLVEQRFGYDQFHETVRAAALNANMHALPPGASMTECFMLDWALKNRRTIEEANERRKYNSSAFTDLGKIDQPVSNDPIPTRAFVGEDGRKYQEINFHDEDTDPVLIEASENRAKILADKAAELEQARQEGLRRLKDAQARKEREQAELEATPGFGCF